MFGYLRRLGADTALAEDLTQETYAKAWRGIATLRKPASLRSWLLTIARNEFLQWVRVERSEVTGVEDLLDREDGRPGADGDLEASERRREVHRAVARLDGSLREVVALHYFQGLSLREIGCVLGIPAGTAKSRINRALSCLRGLLEREGARHENEGDREAFAGRS